MVEPSLEGQGLLWSPWWSGAECRWAHTSGYSHSKGLATAMLPPGSHSRRCMEELGHPFWLSVAPERPLLASVVTDREREPVLKSHSRLLDAVATEIVATFDSDGGHSGNSDRWSKWLLPGVPLGLPYLTLRLTWVCFRKVGLCRYSLVTSGDTLRSYMLGSEDLVVRKSKP